MPKYKNIRIKKRGGGTRLQRVQVLASGKYKFVKNPNSQSHRVTKTKKKTNPKKRRVKRIARRKRRRRSQSMTIPIAPVVGLAAGVSPAIPHLMAGDFNRAINELSKNYTGYDPNARAFNVGFLQRGLVPLILGLLVHKFVGGSPLNLNRTLARAKVPFIRI